MKLGALYLFSGDVVAAWHWKWSITWRWIFNIRKHYSGHKLGFHRFYNPYSGFGFIVWNTRLIDFSFTYQENMARKDLE